MMEEKCESNPIVDRVLEHAARSMQLIQRIAGQERWGGGVIRCQWGFLEDSGEFVHLRRNWLTTKKSQK
jgi:hypothetical protein